MYAYAAPAPVVTTTPAPTTIGVVRPATTKAGTVAPANNGARLPIAAAVANEAAAARLFLNRATELFNVSKYDALISATCSFS